MKKINRVQLLLFVLAITFILTSASLIVNKNITSSKNTDNIEFTSHMNKMNTMDDIIKYSDKVIIGTVISKDEIDESLTKYIVFIDKSLKGDLSSTDIDVYETKNALEVGKQYILFVGYFDSALYPREVYTSMDKDCIIEVANGKLISRNKFGEKNHTLETIIKSIEKSPSINSNNKKTYNVKNEFANIKELIVASDYVIQITTKEVTKVNKYVADVQVNVTHQYKGDIAQIDRFMLPSDSKVEKEYLLFLTNSEGSLVLTSRKGSIIRKDNSNEWNKAIEALKDIN